MTVMEKPLTSAPAMSGKIMIVDDEPINLRVTRKYLVTAGFTEVVTLSDPLDAVRVAIVERPDALLLDVVMPGMSGIELLQLLRAEPATQHLPVLILTASNDRETRQEALQSGATDFIAKPVDPNELMPRLRNTLAAKRYEDSLREQTRHLEELVSIRTEEISRTRIEVVHCLARASEFRDNETGKHILRVGRYASIIAAELKLDPHFIELLELAAPLHDVGKIGIPDQILLKNGKLTPEEFEIMQKHASMGASVFHQLAESETSTVRKHTEMGAEIFGDPKFELLKLAKVIALTHHEKFDGTGYPLGLGGQDIPLAGRIVAVADVFDALSSKRPYKPAFSRQKCFDILQEGRGKHFDPLVLDAFFARSGEITEAQIDLADLD